MPTIAELAQAPVGTPIVGLQAYVSGAYETKPFGQGHMQAVTITDGTAQMLLRIMDGPEIVAGMNLQISALPKEVTIRGQKQMELDGAWTEVYKDKMRFNVKARCLMILAGGPAAPAPAPQPAYQAAAAIQGMPSGGYGFTQGPQPIAPAGPYGVQQPPAYAQPAPPPYGAPGGQPGAFPAVLSLPGDPTPVSAPFAQVVGQGQAAPAKAPWQPPAKMGEAEARGLLEKNYLLLGNNLCRDYGVGSPADLPAEVVAGAMAWATSILIGIQRGDVIREPETDGDGQAPWPAEAQAAAVSPATEAGLAPGQGLSGPEDDDIPFGG